MRNTLLPLLLVGLFVACGRTEKKQSTPELAAVPDPVATAVAPTPRNCQSVVASDQLGKPLEYYESAKPIKVTLTLNQDTSAAQTAGGCYFNNTITVLAIKKSGSQLFKRTLLKDDLLYFVKENEGIKRSILKSVTYKPTFNAERYFNLVMRVVEPGTKKTLDYTLFVNYHGEILKVK